MAGMNERKLEVLEFVAQEGEVTPAQVAEALDMEIHNARMQLQRYWKMNLLHRRMVNRRTKQRLYSISDEGGERIEWLKGEDRRITHLIQQLRKLRDNR